MIIIRKNKLFILVIIQIFVFLLLITNTYATDIAVSTGLTENPINQHTVSEVNEKFNSNNFLINDLDTRFYLFNRKIGADILASNDTFDLRDYYDISVKDQGLTESCWAFSLLSSAELNMQMKTRDTVDLSE